MYIVVLTHGFVFACREIDETPEGSTLTTVRCIRVWGTKNGLGQLVRGPTKETVLDATIPVVSAPRASVLFTFKVDTGAWAEHLK
jgi:hypothetical protein